VASERMTGAKDGREDLERVRSLIDAAREGVDQFMADQRAKHGRPPTHDELLRTAMMAILCGLATEEWAIVAEGYVMLGDLHRMVSGRAYEPESVEAP
jgi:hypothetical protein